MNHLDTINLINSKLKYYPIDESLISSDMINDDINTFCLNIGRDIFYKNINSKSLDLEKIEPFGDAFAKFLLFLCYDKDSTDDDKHIFSKLKNNFKNDGLLCSLYDFGLNQNELYIADYLINKSKLSKEDINLIYYSPKISLFNSNAIILLNNDEVDDCFYFNSGINFLITNYKNLVNNLRNFEPFTIDVISDSQTIFDSQLRDLISIEYNNLDFFENKTFYKQNLNKYEKYYLEQAKNNLLKHKLKFQEDMLISENSLYEKCVFILNEIYDDRPTNFYTDSLEYLTLSLLAKSYFQSEKKGSRFDLLRYDSNNWISKRLFDISSDSFYNYKGNFANSLRLDNFIMDVSQ